MPSIALPVSLRGQLLSGTRTFSPASLFAANEPGVWFDPSDLTTLFQDPAGTTPVTTPGNIVGLMLDKSKGLALGAELVANGTFDTNTNNWTAINSTLSVDANRLKVLSAASYGWASQAFTTVIGKTYKISFDITNGDSSGVYIFVGTDAGLTAANYDSGAKADGSHFAVFTATATTTYFKPTVGGTGKYAFFDNISVRELAGNHATQATIAARPTYSIEPVGGRRNLLTWSEGFNDTIWLKAAGGGGTVATVSPDAAASPTGTVTADLVTIARTATTMASFITQRLTDDGTVKTKSVYLKAFSGTDVGKVLDFWTFDGAVANRNAVTLTADWTRVVLPPATLAAGANREQLALGFLDSGSLSPNTGTVQFLIWGAQLELGSTATPYQRVTTQHDVTEAGVASLSYLYFDGTDDAMVTSTITPGTDKVQVFAGVRKLSDATGIIAETSATVETNAGSLILYSNPNVYGAKTRGSLNISAAVSPAAYTAPTTNVLTGTGDIAGDNFTLRINSTQAAQITENQGTGDFLAYPLFIGRRNNGVTSPSYPLFGHLYSLITRFGPTLDAATIASTEVWVGDKTGIDIAKITSTTIYTRSGDTILDRANSTIERRAV